MRPYVVAIGAVITLSGVYYMLQDTGALTNPPGLSGVTATALGVFDIALGIVMARPSKVLLPPGVDSTAKILVDRGVYRTSVYQLAFFDHKLVMKKLATSRTTILLGLLLTISGAVLETGNLLVGAAAGGLTGYVLQEFLTQKRREGILKDKSLESAGLGDIELFYEKINDVRVKGNHILVSVADRVFRINFPRGYTSKLGFALENTFPSLYKREATRPERAP